MHDRQPVYIGNFTRARGDSATSTGITRAVRRPTGVPQEIPAEHTQFSTAPQAVKPRILSQGIFLHSASPPSAALKSPGLITPQRRYRVLNIAARPVQYAAANLREMARHPRFDLLVAYCSLGGAEAAHDPEFGRTVQWDVPLLDGYEWLQVPNRGDGGESFWGLYNPGLWKIIRSGNLDAIICLTGYRRASFWITFFAARSRGIPLIFGTDASTLEPRARRPWKLFLKRRAWPVLFRLATQVLVVSTPGREMMQSLGIPPDRIALMHNTVDNAWWLSASDAVDRTAVRASWGMDTDERVIVFCAKLQQWKRPLDLLHAFAKAAIPRTSLVIAGEGPMRAQLETEAAALGVAGRVRFLGFVNQSQLPSVYASADLMVLPSEYEPFAMVVNEAMVCGCPVVVSDRVGAAKDLVAPVSPDFIFPHGDVVALAEILCRAFSDPARLKSLRSAVRARMETWSPRENVAGTLAAIERAHTPKRG
jgi:glycosyltransferase involved in cell wall biosynthesis